MIQWFEILEDTYDCHHEGGTETCGYVHYEGKISIFIPNPNYLQREIKTRHQMNAFIKYNATSNLACL